MSGIIYERPSYYLITNVSDIPREIDKDLSKWNPGYFRLDNIGYYYDKSKKELRIPRGYSKINLKRIFSNYEYIEECDWLHNSNIDIGLLAPPKDYMQEYLLTFMLGKEPYVYTRSSTQLYVDMDTGGGKTFLGIATACYFKTKCYISIPAVSKIADQWKDTINRFTTLKRNEFLYVHGSEMCKDIINGKYDNVKIFIMPRSTVTSFVKKYEDNWNMFTKLMDAMDVDLRIIDEAHMDFSTIVKMDCFSNIQKTYYMSSSPGRSENQEEYIYYNLFKNVPKHGKKLKTKEQNHIIPLIVNFKSTPSPEWLKKIKTRYGTSLAKYGEYLLSDSGARDEFIEAYAFTLYWISQFRRKGGKILVICSTIEFAKEMSRITESLFPYLSRGLFVGSGKDKNKELDADIVFSTTKGMGTGSEFINHQFTINTLTYASKIMADQISGRIRKQDGRKGIYCELVNINHKIAREHYNKREQYLINKAKDGKLFTHNISQEDINRTYEFIDKGYKFDDDGKIITKNGYYLIKRKRQ